MKTISCFSALAVLGCLSTVACGAHSDGSDSSSAADSNGGTVCSAEQQVAAYNKMITQPIVPPRMFAGVDLAGGDDWKGQTVEGMEKTLCASTNLGEDDTSVSAAWGISQGEQVQIEYDKTTHVVDFFQLNPGYEGKLDFKSRPTALGDASKPNPFGQHTYSIGVSTPILRDGKPWGLSWSDASAWDSQSTELFDALMYTFAPELKSTQTSCNNTQLCLARPIGGDNQAVFGARPLGIYFHVPDFQKAPSNPDYIYGFAIKNLPSSSADMLVKLDAEGPVATATGLGDKNALCTMKLGMTMQSYLDDCVEVMSSAKANSALEKKALGGAQRVVTTSGSSATGTWELNVSGAHPNFSSARFDETAPTTHSTATEMAVDIRTGRMLNEYSADGTTMTLAATTAIYTEYARTVQDLVHSKMDPSLPQFGLGDAHCQLPADADPTTWTPAKGCTGMEELVLPAVNNGFGAATMLKPGPIEATFCADLGTFNHCGFETCDDSGNNCVQDKLGLSDTIWNGSQKQIIAVLGGGNEANVPAEVRDPNTFLMLWAKAYVKYLRAASQNPTDLSNPSLDGFTPADSDISFVPGANGAVTMKYLTKLEIGLVPTTGDVTTILFR